MVIPGQKDMALERFESTFFDELVAQHDRVNLFVASKASELSYRLGRFLCSFPPCRALLVSSFLRLSPSLSPILSLSPIASLKTRNG